MQVKNISFSSYNVKDFNDDKFLAVKYLFDNSTFLLLQETWLNEKNSSGNLKVILARKVNAFQQIEWMMQILKGDADMVVSV